MTRTALITDACHFVGQSSAKALSDKGVRVFCQDESFTDAGARAAFQAEHAFGTPLAGQTGGELVQEIEAAGSQIDILISNDAYPAERFKVEDADANRLRQTLDRLVVGAFERIGAVVPGMKARGWGRIVLVTSAAPLRGLANYSMYATARGAANALAKSLAIELAPAGITVNALAPNFVESPTYFPPHLMENPETRAKILKNIPLARLGKQEEAAATVAFLASDESGFLTGQVIPLAGGWA